MFSVVDDFFERSRTTLFDDRLCSTVDCWLVAFFNERTFVDNDDSPMTNIFTVEGFSVTFDELTLIDFLLITGFVG